MEETFSLVHAVGVGTFLIGVLFAVIGYLVSRWIDSLRVSMRDLELSDGHLSDVIHSLQIELPREYVRREDFFQTTARIERRIDEMHEEIRRGFELLHTELKQKLDR